MIKNESLDELLLHTDDYYKQKNKLKLSKTYLRNNKLPVSIIARKSKFISLIKNNNSQILNNTLNTSKIRQNQKDSDIEINIENKNHESFNEKLIIQKINDSIPYKNKYINQTTINSKNTTYRVVKKFSQNFSNIKKVSPITFRKIENSKNMSSINLKKNKSLLNKIRKSFLENKEYEDKYNNLMKTIEYRKKLKSVNSSFSEESIYNLEKKLIKDFSSKNILYNNSTFIDSKELPSSNNQFKKIQKNKRINHSCPKENKKFKKLSKYKFIINPLFSTKGVNMKDFKNNLETIGKAAEEIIDKSVNSKVVNHFSLVEKNKFSINYRSFDLNEKQKNLSKIYIQNKYKNLIDKNVYKKYLNLLEIVTEELDKTNEDKILQKIKEKNKNNKNKGNKKNVLERLKKTIISISTFLKQRDISDGDLRNLKLIAQSYTYPETKLLIDAIKIKNLGLCFDILDNHKYIVLDYDYFYLTPLHWAVKNNFYRILPYLLDYGSIIDAGNFVGDTPLHIAVRNNYYDSTCILLYYLASPFSKNKNGKSPMDLTNDYDMKSLLNKIMKLHYSSYFRKNSIQSLYIQSGLWVYIREEFRDKLQKEVFDYFNHKGIKDFFTL